MEASEKPQLSLDQPGGEGTVRALDGRIVIRDLTVADERAAHLVRERQQLGKQPADTVRKAIEIGARVLDSEETAVNVDYVRAELGRGLGKVSQELAEQADEAIESLGEQIAASFGPERSDSVQEQIKKIVAKAGEEQRVAIGRLFSSEDGSNPLTDFKAGVVRALQAADAKRQADEEANRERIEALTREIVELREGREADRRVAEAEDAGTRKGFTFEERVHGAVEHLASIRGDVATHTGGEAAEGGGKKGDTLVELSAASGPAQGRIAFEAKDKRLSKNEAWRELNDCMEGRAAAFGVLVVAGEDRVPAGRETLTEYEGNKLIVAVDREEPDGLALEVAYRLAAARVLQARDNDLKVDPAAVRDTAEEAISLLKHAQAIRSTLTGIQTSSDKAKTSLNTLVEALRLKLEKIESLVADGD
jgi:hypothetical protein